MSQCVWLHIDLLRNISADLQRGYLLPRVTSSPLTILLHPSPTQPSPAVISSPCSSLKFEYIFDYVVSLLIHNSLSVFLLELDSFSSSTPSCSLSLICFPNLSTIFLQFCLHLSLSISRIASPSLHLSGPSTFIHLKPQLMMNETNLPQAQTWVALWDSGQLLKGHSGLIPYSWAVPTTVLLVPCISRDPSFSWHLIFKVNTFFLTAVFPQFLCSQSSL